MDLGGRLSLSHSCFLSLKIMAIIIWLRIKVSTGWFINCRRDVSQSLDRLSKKTSTNCSVDEFSLMNDIFYFKKKASIYNYADDNTVSYSHKNLNLLKEVLVDESATCIEWFRNNKMQANSDKFQAIMLGKSGFENYKSLFLNGTEIKCEDSVKLLCVTINYLLNFDLYVSNICKKAARQINVLLRLSKSLTIETKILIYKSFIRSSFNFCPLVWHFCSKTSSAKMEKLQYRALRLVFNDFDSSYETLLEELTCLHFISVELD